MPRPIERATWMQLLADLPPELGDQPKPSDLSHVPARFPVLLEQPSGASPWRSVEERADRLGELRGRWESMLRP